MILYTSSYLNVFTYRNFLAYFNCHLIIKLPPIIDGYTWKKRVKPQENKQRVLIVHSIFMCIYNHSCPTRIIIIIAARYN